MDDLLAFIFVLAAFVVAFALAGYVQVVMP